MTLKKSKRRVRRGSSTKPLRYGILPDLHIPSHDSGATSWALAGLSQAKIDGLILLGDVVSLDAVSRFQKPPKGLTILEEELAAGRQFFVRLAAAFPHVKERLYLFGNHEARLSSYLIRNAPALVELPQVQLRHLLGLEEDWITVPYGQLVERQSVIFQHGKMFGHNTCRKNLLLGKSVVQGHSHRLSVVHHRFPLGAEIASIELGCLCQLTQSYTSVTDWVWAYGILEGGHVTVVSKVAKEVAA